MREGEPWFVATDVCRILEIGNPSDVIRALDDDEKGLDIIETLGGPQQMAIISEPGLYSLTLRSRKPEAKAFKRWVTHEVIPSIKKTGQYKAPSLSDSDRRLEVIKAEKEMFAATNLNRLADSGLYPPTKVALLVAEATSILTGRPMVEYLPPVALDRERWKTPAQYAEEFGVTPKRVGMVLKESGLHGELDTARKHSEAYWNKAIYSDRQVISYKYDPEVVMPVFKKYFLS
jgi:prophage antirepressor-like protein